MSLRGSVVVILFVAACDRQPDAPAPQPPTHVTGKRSVVTNGDGTKTTVLMDPKILPPEFPATFPLCPGTRLASTAWTAKSVVVALDGATAEQIFACYRRQPDWELMSEVEVDTGKVLRLKARATGQEVRVIATSKEGGGVSVSLLVAKPQP